MLGVLAAGGDVKGYEIENSLLFDNGSSAKLTRTFGVPTLQNTHLVSVWVKRCSLGVSTIIGSGNTVNNWGSVHFSGDDNLQLWKQINSVVEGSTVSSSLYRDPSVWVHVVMSFDGHEAVAADRAKLFVNGVEVLYSLNTPVDLGTGNFLNIDGRIHEIGNVYLQSRYADLYMAQFVFLDGVSFQTGEVSIEDFGEWKPKTDGIWQAKDVTGLDYSGNNSFLLDFANPVDIGADVSGNGNSWTPVNINSRDQSQESPSNNFATWNYVDGIYNGIKNGNRYAATYYANTGEGWGSYLYGNTTMYMETGKWYAEVRTGQLSTAHYPCIGIAGNDNKSTHVIYYSTGSKVIDSVVTAYGSVIGDPAIIGIAFDMDNDTVEFFNNGVSQGVINTPLDVPMCITNGDGSAAASSWFNLNAGTDPSFNGGVTPNSFTDENGFGEFNYQPPAGFLAMCSNNFTFPVIPSPNKHLDIVTWTGDGAASRTIPTENKVNFVMIKARTPAARDWRFFDDVRGATNKLSSNATYVDTVEADGVTAFGAASGFDVGSGSGVNLNGESHVGYPVTVSPLSGIDIVTYTGDGLSNRTISHDLGVLPEMWWVKSRTVANSWMVYHAGLGNDWRMELDTNIAAISSVLWENTDPTASVFTVSNHSFVNGSGVDYIAYLFTSVEGFSKVFKYVGNGSATDGEFVYCGFKPAWLMIKRGTGSTASWRVYDIRRSVVNPANDLIYMDTFAVEDTNKAAEDIDLNANGFKIRGNSGGINTSGNDYVGIAFAEYPFAMINNREL